ncbi:long-chain-fatty-acyl-CoA reductase [Leptospira perolatii]|uniref:Acyl-CoA reductase n=2 Tax=Leptospira perolatii TaxID=2023191 RepID=A0A2M9ZR18_9LEPT|nr:long-chain-fatty-acyl-CoA reductase [Leptospira perolatii]PJZ74475.1 long-chain-fatty-acyl-CoA reductase [Leptospira perolatii]
MLGGEVSFPNPEILTSLLESLHNPLIEVSTQDIIGFLHRLGKMWENDEYIRRRVYIRQMCDFVGYSEQMAVAEADLIAATLRGSTRLWDTLQVELGDRSILDTWIKREDCEVKAFPKGTVTHILSGNAPVAAVLSILRSLLTKNQTIAKVASGDPITPTQFALSFLDLDAKHPLSRSLHTAYWPSDSEIGVSIVGNTDAVCVWGGAEAVRWTYKNVKPGSEILTFGPKRSFSLIGGSGQKDLKNAARLVAHDVSMYDQQACFSTQHIFVLGDQFEFATELGSALDRNQKILSAPKRTVDQAADVSLSKIHHEFFGGKILYSEDHSWQVILSSPGKTYRHPGARTAFVHKIDSIEQVLSFVDSSVQTVAVYPMEIVKHFRDSLGRLGISRVVECGSSGMYRLGASHDGMYPLARLVRFVSMEAPSEVYPKGMTIPMDMSKIIEHRQFRDLFV